MAWSRHISLIFIIVLHPCCNHQPELLLLATLIVMSVVTDQIIGSKSRCIALGTCAVASNVTWIEGISIPLYSSSPPPPSRSLCLISSSLLSMDPDNEVEADHMPFFRVYKSGRTERFEVIESCPPSADAATGVSSKDAAIPQDSGSVSARLYIPTSVAAENSSSPRQIRRLPVLVYYHGGAFCCGSAFAKDIHTYLNTLVAEANILVVSVNYRLAPEHPIPAAYEDSWLALRWVVSRADEWLRDHADLEQVFLGGESAGANIAHHMAMRAGTDPLEHSVRVEGLVLFQPYFLQAEPTESDSIDTGMSSGLKDLWKIACPSSTTGLDDDHRINPAAEGAPSLSVLGCGRVLVCVAERDALRDRGRDYYERLRSCGWKGEVELYESRGEGHVFQVIKPTCDESRALTRKVGCFINLAQKI